MIRFFITSGLIIFVAILIWIYINRNILKKVVKCIWAHYAVLYGKFEKDEINYDNLIEETPIKRSMALKIANQNNTLKTDFCRNSHREGISYLSFDNYTIDLIEKDNKKYWQYQVFSGDISWINYQGNETEFCDGKLAEDDLKFLRCLIDTETGDYIYYPDVVKYDQRVVEYEDAINGVIKINENPPEWLERLEKDE